MQWWKKEAVYQIYPKSFCDSDNDGIGDLNGIISRLDYIKSLGVGAIWLSPVFDSPQADNGYDVSDYYSIYAPYGSLEDMETLICEAHARELKVIMDLVINHTSCEHKWFVESKDPESPYRDFYYWHEGTQECPPNNWRGMFSESAWSYDEDAKAWYFHTFSPQQPDLNWNNEKVTEEFCNIIRFWQDKGVDGWRVDAVPYIDKDPSFSDYDPADFPMGQKFFYGKKHFRNGNLKERVRALNLMAWNKIEDCMTVAELGEDFDRDEVLDLTRDGDAFTMCFSLDHVFMDVDFSQNRGKWAKKDFSLVEFKRIIAYWQELNSMGGNTAIFLNSHDQPRAVSRFVDCGEYHDQYAKLLAIVMNTLGGTPFIYQGEEIGMTNCRFDLEEYRDIEVLNAFDEIVRSGVLSKEDFLREAAYRCRDNARTPVQWDDSENAGFTKGQPWIKINENYKEINVAAQQDDPDSVLSCYKKLFELRRDIRVLQCGVFELLAPNDEEVFTFTRRLQNKKLFVSANFTDKEVTRKLPFMLGHKSDRLLISSYPDSVNPPKRYTLRPFECIAVMFE